MRISFEHAGDILTVYADPHGDGYRVTLPDGSIHDITVSRLPGDLVQLYDVARTYRVPFAELAKGGIDLSYQGRQYSLTPSTSGRPDRKSSAGGRQGGTVTAPMGGVVADVHVAPGDTVAAYQVLLVVEAMKVYATLEAPIAGVVKSVHVTKGQRVELGQELVVVEAPAE